MIDHINDELENSDYANDNEYEEIGEDDYDFLNGEIIDPSQSLFSAAFASAQHHASQ